MELNERSSFAEVMTQVQDNHIGELMGRLTEAETKLSMAVLHNQKLLEKLKDYEDTKEKANEIKQQYDALVTNVEGLKASLKDARAGRQAAQEQLMNCCGKFKKPTKKKVKDVEHNQAEKK